MRSTSGKRDPPTRSLTPVVIVPVVAVGLLLAGVLVAAVSPPIRDHFERQVTSDLELAAELSLRVCEGAFDQLLSLRLSENAAMVETVRRDALEEIESLSEWFPGVYLLIVEEQGHVVLNTCDCPVDVSVVANLPRRAPDRPPTLGIAGEAMVNWVYFPLWRWTIVAFERHAESLAPLRMAQRAILFSALMTTAGLVTAFLFVFHRTVTRRLRLIGGAADELSHGAYPRIDLRRMDEIGLVGKAFDGMVESIAEKDRAAEDAYIRVAESESRFRRIIEASAAGYFFISPSGRLRKVNRAFVVLHGYSTPEDVIGRSIADLLAEDSLPQARAYLDGLRRGETIESGELVGLTRKAERRFNTFSAVPVYDGGALVGAEGFVIDTTVQRQTAVYLRQSLREKEVLLQEVHHRVRNNLNVVVSLLRLQSADLPANHPTTAAFHAAQSRIMSMAHVHSLLYESESLGSLNVRDYVDRLVREVLAGANRGIAFEKDVEPIEVSLERAVPLGLIINEAVTNAVKHAFHHIDSPKVSVRYRRDGYVERLWIRDNGAGVDLADMRHRASLGVTLMEELSKQLGGTLQVENDGGTAITVTIPVEE